eukprot:gene13308-16898_t
MVIPFGEEDIARECFGGIEGEGTPATHLKQNNAYLLFYSRRTDESAIVVTAANDGMKSTSNNNVMPRGSDYGSASNRGSFSADQRSALGNGSSGGLIFSPRFSSGVAWTESASQSSSRGSLSQLQQQQQQQLEPKKDTSDGDIVYEISASEDEET